MCSDVFSPSFASPSFCFAGQSLLLATALFGSMFYLFGRRRSQHQNGPSECPQAIELEDSPGVFKSGMLKDRPTELVIERFFPEVGTLWDAFQRGLAKSEKGPCLGWRPTPNSPYEFITFGQVAEKSKSLGAALIGKLGLEPGNGTFVGIYAKNCPEWTITALACVRHSMVVVPLYDTLGADSAAFILSHTEAKVVVVDELERLENILSMEGKVPELRHILLVERPKEEGKMEEMGRRAAKNGWSIHLFGDLVQNGGGKEEQEDHEPKAEDMYIVCYTSGTTGTPKGVVLSHKNVVANLSGMAVLFDKFLPNLMESTEHSVISYLPLSHMFEQCCHWAALCLGFRVGFFSGNIAKLSGDMQALEPTLFPVVPRLLNRFNDTIKAELARSSPIKRLLFSLAKSQKSALYEKGIVTNGTIWDRMVFSKAQKQLGGKVQLIVTGSAPIAAEVLKELRIIFGTQIIEGYGQTECTAMATCTIPGDTSGGHCGGPAACTLLKLADVPELNYFARERKGEVMVKGPSVTKGYYRDEEKTAELFDEQGFLHTGDIGHLLANGTLRIIDRKKHIFKLAQGEYVAPEKIENVYIQCSLVQQIYVDGDSLERFLVAVVVPPEKAIRRIYGEMGEDGREKSFEEICADKRVKKAILEEMGKIGKEQRLNSIEKVKAIHVEAEMFSVENGLLTPTLKAKRPQLRQKYRETIGKLYREIDGRQS